MNTKAFQPKTTVILALFPLLMCCIQLKDTINLHMHALVYNLKGYTKS